MRKLILIAAFALASVSAQAGERIDRVPAENDAPAAAATPAAAPPATAATAKPQISRKQISRTQASRTQASGKQAYRSRDRASARPTSRRRAGSPPSMASPGDPGCHHRGGGGLAGACLAEQSPRRWHHQARGLQDKDEDHLSGSRGVQPLFQGGRPHLPALQSAAASDHWSLTGDGTSSKFLRRPCRLRA